MTEGIITSGAHAAAELFLAQIYAAQMCLRCADATILPLTHLSLSQTQ